MPDGYMFMSAYGKCKGEKREIERVVSEAKLTEIRNVWKMENEAEKVSFKGSCGETNTRKNKGMLCM